MCYRRCRVTPAREISRKSKFSKPANRLVLRIKHSPGNSGVSRPHSTTDDSVERALALADAIVTSAGGEFNVSTSPLLIVADFPVNNGTGALQPRKTPRPNS